MMKKTVFTIGGGACTLYEQERPEFLLLQPVDEHDLAALEHEIETICSLTSRSFVFVAIKIEDWQRELSPWAAPAVFGRMPFGEGAQGTLAFITNMLTPWLSAARGYDMQHMRCLLGGYSLAGLFALWAGYNSSCFEGIAAASPSVWFLRWKSYILSHRMKAQTVYLSLGDKEEKVRNAVMAQVGGAIRMQHEQLRAHGVACTLEWNEGNHFKDSGGRTAKAFAWLMGKCGNV